MLVMCIGFYSGFDIDYDDVQYEELTFNKHEVVSVGKGGSLHIIYFDEYAIPFEISNITNKKLDKQALGELEAGEIIKVYYFESSSKNYEYEICEMKSASKTLLSLSDYVAANQNNQVVGIVFNTVMIVISSLLVLLFACSLVSMYRLNKYGDYNKRLGKVKIEYVVDKNVIQVFNSPDICSLVINGKVVDRYIGLVATQFHLKGKLKFKDKEVLVEAKMGHFNIRLYYDGEVVGKAFMAFG
jgi:hypothetical protein